MGISSRITVSDNDKLGRVKRGLNIGRRTALKLGGAAGLMALAPSTAGGSTHSEPVPAQHSRITMIDPLTMIC